MVPQKNIHLLEGIPASPGIAIGKAFVLAGDIVKVEQRDIAKEQVQEEINKFNTAIETTKNELKNIQVEIKKIQKTIQSKKLNLRHLKDLHCIDEIKLHEIQDTKKSLDAFP